MVIISPADRDLILEGSDTRRKFIDGVISQSNKIYLQTLLKYNKTLLQRNSLLKYFAVNHTFDKTTLSVYNEQLQEFGTIIHKERVAFLDSFIPIFKEQYAAISGGKENVTINYNSKLLEKDLLQLFDENLDKDRAVQYTTVGIHKDDLSFEIDEYPIKKFGSQGQQKSFFNSFKISSV